MQNRLYMIHAPSELIQNRLYISIITRFTPKSHGTRRYFGWSPIAISQARSSVLITVPENPNRIPHRGKLPGEEKNPGVLLCGFAQKGTTLRPHPKAWAKREKRVQKLPRKVRSARAMPNEPHPKYM